MSLIGRYKIVQVIKNSLMLGIVPPVKLVPELVKEILYLMYQTNWLNYLL